MNRLETRYSKVLEFRRLEGSVELWRFERFKLRLGRGAWYTVDFWVVLSDGQVECHEVKGFQREAAMVRIKTAADLYPELRFLLVKRERGEWRTREILPA